MMVDISNKKNNIISDSNNKDILLSVIVPCFNEIDTIESLKNFEVNNFKFEKLLSKTNTLLFTA